MSHKPESIGKLTTGVLLVAAALGIGGPAHSAPPLAVATDPLGTATSNLNPNIMVILDDSGSMASDFMPDYVDDIHNPPSTTAACAANGDNGGINSTPQGCVIGDPPYTSPDLNGIYYNPDIRYDPAKDDTGAELATQNAANTANFTAVLTNPYTGSATVNLATGYADRVWCKNQSDAANGGNCRQNSAYQYPDALFPFGADTSGSIKYLNGSPYYYQMQTAQWCTSAARTTCVSGSAVNPAVHTFLAPEFCTDRELTTCAAGAAVTSAHVFSGVRWCSDAGTLVKCQRKKIGAFVYAKHLGTTVSQTGTFAAVQNEGNISVTSVIAAPAGTYANGIQNITIGGITVVSGPISVTAGSTPTAVAANIATAINSFASTPDYTAVASGSNVAVTKVTAGATGAGLAIAVTTGTVGTGSSVGRITVGTGSAPGTSQTLLTITVNGVNLLCPIGAIDTSYGNGVSVILSGAIVASSGTSSTAKRASLRSAIQARVQACGINGYTAAISGSDVNLTAPVAQGATPNGQTVARTGTGTLTNITTTNMGGVTLGTSTNVVGSTTAAMSGGQDAFTGTRTVRIGVGQFVRTDIDPVNNIYPKGPGRTDCVGATCTYAEEMTNFSNWYAYYRNRMYMMKGALSRAFASSQIDTTYRVGFITICPVSGGCTNTGNTLGQSVVSSKYLKIADWTGAQKTSWYTKLFNTQPLSFTPLREAVARVGLIYAGQLGSGLTTGLSVAAGDDPMTKSCQPNFALLATDGYWNGGPGRLIDNSTAMTNQDNVDSGFSKQVDGAFDGGTPVASGTLADVAMYYYKTDLRPSMTDNVPATTKDSANHQHMVLFTIGLGLDGTLSFRPDYESAATGDFVNIKQGTIKWPVPVADTPTALDDLWHAAVNARGVFYSAKNPQDVTNGLTDALNQLQERVGAGAAAATSNLQPIAGDNYAFTAQYQTSDWIGDLKARTIDLVTGAVSSVSLWSAANKLDTTAPSSRRIYTFDPTDTTGNLLKHFCWPLAGGTNCADGAGLDATEQAYFDPALMKQWINNDWNAGQKATVTAQSLVDYIRGETAYENTNQSLNTDLFRNRVSILGDFVNAQPSYAKKSPFQYNDTGFAGFKACTAGTGSSCNSAQFPNATISRRGTVYAAANDGFLHAFETDINNNPYFQTAGISTLTTLDDAFTGNNAGNGVERWAYLPRIIMSNMFKLAEAPYNHRYFTDGSPQLGDICISTPCAGQDDWRTILVAGLNSGGIGYYALDVTDPLAPKALWEFTNKGVCQTTATISSSTGAFDDCNLGMSFGNPVITKRTFDGKWVVLVTSGYNNNVGGGDGQGYLYILDAATGKILNRIVTPSAPAATTAAPSGLAKINGWALNGTFDNTVVSVYGGDLNGDLWRFDLDYRAGTNTNYLGVTRVATVVDASGVAQPITVKPELGEYSTHRIILFGTGLFLEDNDKVEPPTFQNQAIYALRDDPSVTTSPVIANVRSTTLVKQRSLVAGATANERTVAAGTAPNWATEWGWLIDLPDHGERVNVDPQLQLGTLVIASNVPQAGNCTAGGFSFVNFLDYATGSYVAGAAGNMASTKIASSLVVGLNVIMLPGNKVEAIITTADNQTPTMPPPIGQKPFEGRRVSWRELIVDQ